MTVRNLDRLLPDVLGDLADAPYPDYVEQVLATTATRRQRPAWSFPRRWFPMIVSTQAVPRPGLPWRPIAIVALLAMALAASIGVFMAAQQRPAPWFGPATNGLVAFAEDGAIKTADPATGEVRVLKADAEGWMDPWYSPDGQTLLLAREPTSSSVEFAVMPASGGAIRVITPEPLVESGYVDFSPDGRSIILDTLASLEVSPGVVERRRTVVIIDVASGAQRVLDLGDEVRDPTAIPPDGSRLLATAGTDDDLRLVTIDVETGTMTTLLEPEAGRDLVGIARVSPDGRWLAYADFSPEDRHGQLHVRAMDGAGSDRVMDDIDGVDWVSWPLWSPDGRTLAAELMTITDYRDVPRLGFYDVGTGVGRRVDDLVVYDGMSKEWSPESDKLLLSVVLGDDPQPQLLVDPTTLTVTTPSWSATSYPSWQRVAP